MLKQIFMLIVKILESKLIKSGVENSILKNQVYITVAKQVWNIIEENCRITEKVEDKLKSKADEFDKQLLKKFPELTQDDVAALRQSIAGEINKDKQAIVSDSELLKQLQCENASLLAEHVTLNDKIAQIQTAASLLQKPSDTK